MICFNKNTVERKTNYYEHKYKWYLVLVTYDNCVLWKWVKNNWVYWRLWTVDETLEDGTRCAETYKGHTQKNGALLIVNTIKTAPFFCVHPL
jgi:hypothetical protein